MSKGTGYFRPRSREEALGATSQPMPVLASKSADHPGTSSCDQDRVKPADNYGLPRGSPRSSSTGDRIRSHIGGVGSTCRSTRSTARVSRFAAAGNPPFTSQSMNIGTCAPNKPVHLGSPAVTTSARASLTGAFLSGEQTQQSTDSQGCCSSTSTLLFTPVLCVPPPTAYVHSWDEQVTATAVSTRSSNGNSSGSMPGYISLGVPPAVPLAAAAPSSNPHAASYAVAGGWPAEQGSSLGILGSCAAAPAAAQGSEVPALHWQQQDQALVTPDYRVPMLQVSPSAPAHHPQLTYQQQDLALLQLQQEYEAASATAAAVLRRAQARFVAVQQVESPSGACSQQLLQCTPGFTSTSIVGVEGMASGTTNSAALVACGQANTTLLLQQQQQQLQHLQQQQQQQLQHLQQQLEQLQLQHQQQQLQLQHTLLPACAGSGELPIYAAGSQGQLVTPIAVVTSDWAPGTRLTDPPSLVCSSSSSMVSAGMHPLVCSSSSTLVSAGMYPLQGSSTLVGPAPMYSTGGGQCVMGNNVAAVAAAAAAAAVGYDTPGQAQ